MRVNRVEAVAEAMTWCLTWGYDDLTLELNRDEFIDLLTEKNDFWQTVAPLARSSTYVKLFGVDVRQEEFPRKSMIRTRYLQLTNAATWIEWLAQEMEQYA